MQAQSNPIGCPSLKRHPCRSSCLGIGPWDRAVGPGRGTGPWDQSVGPAWWDRVSRGRPRARAEARSEPGKPQCRYGGPGTSGSSRSDDHPSAPMMGVPGRLCQKGGSCPPRARRRACRATRRVANAGLNAHFCPLCPSHGAKPRDQFVPSRVRARARGPRLVRGPTAAGAGPHRHGHSKLEASRTEKGHGQAGWAHCHCYGCQSGDR